MADEVKQAVDGLMTAFEQFKAANDENLKKRDTVLDDKLARINADINKYEGINAKLTAAEQQAKDAADGLKEAQDSLDRIEAKLNRPGAGGDRDGKTAAAHEAFFDHIRYGDMMKAERKAMLTVGDDSKSGFLAPSEYVLEIVKDEIEFSPLRQYVRTRTTSNRSASMPVKKGSIAARWVGEIRSSNDDTGTLRYGLEDIPTNELVAEVPISMQDLEDSAFDIEGELRMEFVEQFGVAEGAAIVSGNGVKKPEGFLVAAGVTEKNSGNATKVTADGIIDLTHAIKTTYARRGLLTLNRNTMASIRKLKDGEGNYLWRPGIAEGRPNTIDGTPYIECPDMPDEGAGAYPIAFGDWRRAYVLMDRLQLSVLRDPYTRSSEGLVNFIARRRLGGQVILPPAIAKLKCVAA